MNCIHNQSVGVLREECAAEAYGDDLLYYVCNVRDIIGLSDILSSSNRCFGIRQSLNELIRKRDDVGLGSSLAIRKRL